MVCISARTTNSRAPAGGRPSAPEGRGGGVGRGGLMLEGRGEVEGGGDGGGNVGRGASDVLFMNMHVLIYMCMCIS